MLCLVSKVNLAFLPKVIKAIDLTATSLFSHRHQDNSSLPLIRGTPEYKARLVSLLLATNTSSSPCAINAESRRRTVKNRIQQWIPVHRSKLDSFSSSYYRQLGTLLLQHIIVKLDSFNSSYYRQPSPSQGISAHFSKVNSILLL